MSKVNIKILSPVHIGNGNFLRYNSDFVEYKAKGEEYTSLYIIDPKKILQLIGDDKIDHWVASIERNEDTVNLVSRLGKGATPDMYALRKLENYVNSKIKDSDTLKECIHDGLGRPYIPGSSIKGAIRSAVLTSLSVDIESKESLIKVQSNYGNRISVSAKPIESVIFGKDPYNDWFRFVKIGDAYFEEDSLISTRAINLNIREMDSLIDVSKSQIVEAITFDYESETRMKVDMNHYRSISANAFNGCRMPKEIDSLNALFKMVNQHTIKLLNEEIEYWNDVQTESNREGADEYIYNLNDLLKIAKGCTQTNGKECVLRLGYAIGWRFITGAWTEKLENFESLVVPNARPNNNNYRDYDFPKSRRLDKGNDVFGFVKLTIKE